MQLAVYLNGLTLNCGITWCEDSITLELVKGTTKEKRGMDPRVKNHD
jgi:hypothetical protein